MTKKILLAVTGASGSLYAARFVEALQTSQHELNVVFSETAKKVCLYELRSKGSKDSSDFFKKLLRRKKEAHNISALKVYDNSDLFAACASGSSVPDTMVVLPCSMGTIARIRAGISGNLIERAADVILKQGKTLIICPRESPYNLIHLENMTHLCRMGAHIVPLSPGFYHHPKDIEDLIDFMIGRIMELMNIPHTLYPKWGTLT